VDISYQRPSPGHGAPEFLPYAAPGDRPRRRRPRAALENWENEGGNLLVTPLSRPTGHRTAREADALEAALRDMTHALSRDFSEGRVGARYNSYVHRSRVLRQLTARLLAMRDPEPAA